MNRCFVFAARNSKELRRDPLTLLFTMALPIALLGLMSLIYQSAPVETFAPANFTPGMAVFSLSFLALFAGMLLANDRNSSFLMRVFASPLTATDYILGYTFPLLLAALLQSTLCFAAAFLFGLPVTIHVLVALAVLLPAAALFIGMGILMGTLLSVKQVTGIGNVIIQVAALLGGTWFDLALLGGVVEGIGNALPFAHALEATRAALAGNWADILPHLVWVAGYAVVIFFCAVLAFCWRMRSGRQ